MSRGTEKAGPKESFLSRFAEVVGLKAKADDKLPNPSANINFNARDRLGRTILMDAVIIGGEEGLEGVKTMLEHRAELGIDLTIKDNHNKTAYDYAMELAELLDGKDDVAHGRCIEMASRLSGAATAQIDSIVDKLDDPGNGEVAIEDIAQINALMGAGGIYWETQESAKGYYGLEEKKGKSKNEPKKNDADYLIEAIYRDDELMVQILLQYGVGLDSKGSKGETPWDAIKQVNDPEINDIVKGYEHEHRINPLDITSDNGIESKDGNNHVVQGLFTKTVIEHEVSHKPVSFVDLVVNENPGNGSMIPTRR